MANFQTQTQWENESIDLPQAELSSTDDLDGGHSHKKIYIIIGLLFSLALTTAFSVYNFARPIEGTWIRQADDNVGAEGMIVEVVRSGAFYEGKVVSDSVDKTKFKSGQIKWFQLHKVGFGVYEFYDLCEDEETNTFYYDGVVSTLTVQAGGKSLTLDAPKHAQGAHQIWIKQ